MKKLNCELISGAEFDKMRVTPNTVENNSAGTQRRDPFGSAPFANQDKQC